MLQAAIRLRKPRTNFKH